MRRSPAIIISITVLLVSLFFVTDLSAEGFLGGRLTVSGGYAVRVLDGTVKWADGSTFKITAPSVSELIVVEQPSGITIKTAYGNEHGYGLSSAVFHGFGFCLDYRLAHRWSLYLGYDMFWARTGRTKLQWEADPSGLYAGYSGSFNNEVDFRFHQMTLGLRFYVVPERLYVLFTSEPCIVKRVENYVWKRNEDGTERITNRGSFENLTFHGGHAAGAGYQFPLNPRMQLAIEADYRFRVEETYNGLSVRIHVRYRL